ncbi:MAG: rhomboid family intramembrane serine protease [Verrucomicrobiae bacterium]|nr:rhomboid family intramembrane serine protease [Verrucomicrobiae bacterium]
MIDDRDYMRQPEFGGSRWSPRFGFRWSLTVGFLIAYVVVYVTELAVPRLFPQTAGFFYQYLALSNEGLAHGFVWQLVTYQFMHAGFLHLFFNCWAIYVFGVTLEAELGGRRFVALMLSSGVVGGLLQSVMAYLLPHYFGGSVVGASACAFGLVAAFALLYPVCELTMLVFFVIPVNVQARFLLIISAGLALLGIIMSFFVNSGHVAHAAHLGGMAMGWFFVRKILHRDDWSRLAGESGPAGRSQPRRPKLEPLEPASDTDFLQNQVDAILDKISAHGMKSLTTREREILESARKKMSKS